MIWQNCKSKPVCCYHADLFSPLLSPMMVAGAQGLAHDYTPICLRLKLPVVKLWTADWGPGRSCFGKPKNGSEIPTQDKSTHIRVDIGCAGRNLFICPPILNKQQTALFCNRTWGILMQRLHFRKRKTFATGHCEKSAVLHWYSERENALPKMLRKGIQKG